MLRDLLANFVTLWAVIDPIGSLPVFLAVTHKVPRERLKRVATEAVLVATGVLVGFLVVGQIILNALGVSIASFQVAGGIVLFRFAMGMIFHEPKSAQPDEHIVEGNPAIFPVGMPAIAGPGAILAVVTLTDNDRFSVIDQLDTAIVLLVVLFIQWLLLLAAGRIQKLLGHGGINILSRVMGLLLAALSVESVVLGLRGLGVLKG